MADIRRGTGVVFQEAIDALADRLALPPADWLALLREADRAATDRSAGMSDALVRDLVAAIKEAMEQGTTAATFRDTFDALTRRHGWGGGNDEGWRSNLTFRVMTAQAAAAGRWRQITRLAKHRPYLRYVTAGDARVRPAHAAWHGTILRWDDPWWDTHFPPNGFNCRCHAMSLSEDDLDRYGFTVSPAPPPTASEIRFVRVNGRVRPVETEKGIDPGFGFNPGKIGLRPPDREQGLFGSLPRQWPPAPATEMEALVLAERVADGQSDWEQTLSDLEIESIEAYKGTGFAPVNAMLRGHDLDPDDFEFASHLAAILTGALDRARLPLAVTTFRGVPPDVAAVHYTHAVGETFDEPAFVSSSLLEERAYQFGDFMIEAVYPAGTEAIALVHFLPDIMNNEIEMLLAPGKTFKVLARRGRRILVELVT